MNLDYAKIKEAAQNYEKDMTKFLRDIVKFPGESCDEKAHIDRIAEEMKKLEFAKAKAHELGVNPGIDPFMTLSSMALPVIPSLRITTRGVFDVTTQSYV